MATGWGNKAWGSSEWGDLSDETVVVSSVAATSSIGSSTTKLDVDVTAASLSLTSSPGDVTQDISLDLPVTGVQANFQNLGTVTPATGQDIDVSGTEATSSTGTATIDEAFLIGEGWGRETWGSFVWGDNYSVLANGIELTASTGNEDAFTDVTVAVSGNEAQTAITPVGTSADSDNEIAHSFLLTGSLGSPTITGLALVEPSGIEATASAGNVEAGTIQEVPVSGIEATTNVGDTEVVGESIVSVSGIEATASTEDVVVVSTYDATGSEITASAGQITAVGQAVISVTGIELTATASSPNIIAWAEIDTGTPVNWSEVNTGTEVTWTEVDQAA